MCVCVCVCACVYVCMVWVIKKYPFRVFKKVAF